MSDIGKQGNSNVIEVVRAGRVDKTASHEYQIAHKYQIYM